MSQMTFNGVSLFANYSSPATGAFESVFRNDSTNHTVSIHTGTLRGLQVQISLHKAALLAALTMTNDVNFTAEEFGTTIGTAANQRHVNNSTNDKAIAGQIISFAAEDSTQVWDLDAVSMGFFQKGIGDISFLRAQVEDRCPDLVCRRYLVCAADQYSSCSWRIEDVDIAEESSNLSKYSILTQAASMLTQANSTNDVALMLLR